MKKQCKIFSGLLTLPRTVCAFAALTMALGLLTACTPTGEIVASPAPSSSVEPSVPSNEPPSMEPAEQPSSDPLPVQSAPASGTVTAPSTQPSTAQPPVQSAPPAASGSQPSSSPAAPTFPEIPVDDDTRSCPVPDFLDKDQQTLYHRALFVYSCLFGGDTSEVCIGNEDKFPNMEETVERNGILYTKARGRYAAWADFNAMIHSVFTDNFWAERNEDTIFINIDGTLYYLNAAMGREYRNENFPDTFKLNSKTDDEITFTLTGYYSSPWPNEGETSEQRDQRLKNGWEYTLDFTIKLVRTAEGWRFDEFHSTAGDQVGPEES